MYSQSNVANIATDSYLNPDLTAFSSNVSKENEIESDEDNDSADSIIKDDSHGAAMILDRSLIGDRNGLKTLIMRAAYDNKVKVKKLAFNS